MIFKDRHDAARQLLEKLKIYKNNKKAIILAIPRGSLEIGYLLSKELNIPLDIIITKKIGMPGNPELAIGAVGPEEVILYEDLIKTYSVSKEYIKNEVSRLKEEIKRRYQTYHKGPLPDLKEKIVIVVDDGIATGQTILAAVKYVKKQKPEKIIIAVPVAPKESQNLIKKEVDEFICLYFPDLFFAVGEFYESFPQLEDNDVINLLKKSKSILYFINF